jgi:AraC family transcriptional regulator
MQVLADAHIVVWEGGSLWVVDAVPGGPARPERTDTHAHHAIQVTVGLGGRFRLEAGGAQLGGDAIAVAADVPHNFAAEGLVAILFVEPESRLGRAVAKDLLGGLPLAVVPPDVVGAFSRHAAEAYRAGARDDTVLIQLGRDLVARMAGDTRGDSPDLRVRRMIAQANAQLDGRVSLADVLPTAGLSAGRLSHLFVEQTGLPFRTYLLWLRLTRAVACVAAGASLTQAAHEAGFADSAHFSRTFRRMFGVAPASLRMT